MKILAIDVSISGCSVAVLVTETGHSVVRREETDRGQAELLIPMVEEVLRACGDGGLQPENLDCIAVTCGPGSFTGVRIGLSAARSLGLALDIPVSGFSTLDVLATEARSEDALYLIDTKRGDYYGQIGQGGEPRIWSADEVAAFQGTVIKDKIPDILTLAAMGVEKFATLDQKTASCYDIAHAPQPIYLREAEVSVSKKKNLDIIISE